MLKVLLYIAPLTITSITGVLVSAIFILKLTFSPATCQYQCFHKLCLVKTISNLIGSSIFAFWVVPLSSLELSQEDVPTLLNTVLSQILRGYCFLFGPLIQNLMAVNRFVALYFPVAKIQMNSYPITNLAIIGCLLVSSAPAVISIYISNTF
uniref:7TM_GPCR_Srx domain-containing protein n=1 Tax=Caenorhabditis japonica TaxID=281687 RepID=A0A8R1E434_CAEJA